MNREAVLELGSSLTAVVVPAIVFGVSVLAVSDYGAAPLVIWSISIAAVVGLFFSEAARSAIYDELVGKEEKDESDSTSSGTSSDRDELREFVCLDSLSVQSLLASLHVDIPDAATEVSQQTERVQRRAGLNAGISGQGGVGVKGNIGVSSAETETDLLETSKKITDQHIFDELYEQLDDRDKIKTLPDYWENSPEDYNLEAEDLDVIEISATGKTDPVYRIANILSLLSRVEVLREYQSQDGTTTNQDPVKLSQVADDIRDIVFADQVGVEFEVDDRLSYVASVDTDNLWVDDPRREFADSREYTVLGRVVGKIPDDSEWDYIDLLRITSSVLDKNSLRTIRDIITIFLDLVDGLSQNLTLDKLRNAEREDIGDIDFQTLLVDDDEDSQSAIQIRIKDKTICVEGPGLVIEPIAIYW